MGNKLLNFLKSDQEKLEEIVEKYPKQIPANVAAEYFGVSPNNMRQSLKGGEYGFSWRNEGKLNTGNCIPTAVFVRKVLNVKGVL